MDDNRNGQYDKVSTVSNSVCAGGCVLFMSGMDGSLQGHEKPLMFSKTRTCADELSACQTALNHQPLL